MEENKFNQLCVWPGLVLKDDNHDEFINFFKERMDARIKIADIVLTNPDLDSNGNTIEGTGGRSDVLFYVHDDDIQHFALPRLKLGIRWWEDVVKYNNGAYLYPDEILDKYPPTW